MLPLWKTVELDGGSSITLYRWGPVDLEAYSSVVMRFVLWFGGAALTGEVEESIPEGQFKNLNAVLRKSARGRKLPDLSLNDYLTVSDALWELNGMGGDGLKKLLSRYSELMAMRAAQEKARVLNMN